MPERSRWGGGWALGEHVMAGAGDRRETPGEQGPRHGSTGRMSCLLMEPRLQKSWSITWLLQFSIPVDEGGCQLKAAAISA